ncbi:MAG: hypothetical protein IJD38_08890 [Clostridia bacterium]|nr:hypothetical protein [Clostridia bacterium]
MEPKDYTLVSIEGEYAYLREIGESDPEKDIYIALALLPPGVDVGDKLHYEMFAYTPVE